MKTDETNGKEKAQSHDHSVAESLEQIVKAIAAANAKLDHMIFLQREYRHAYGENHEFYRDYRAYDE
jgi:hypothetical protein